MSSRAAQLEAVERLLEIIDNLRENCPWDRKQTFQSLRHLTIEETYELGDAILENDYGEIKKELGDLLLHIIFYAKIGSEKKVFDIGDIANHISDKLIERHPHIYGNTNAIDAEEVSKNWETIKLKEGNKSVLEGVPNGLPALVKALRIQEKVSGVGFDWDNSEGVLNKVKEELEELRKEVIDKNINEMELEFGDLLFSLINYARFLKINPETALELTNKKFIKRFKFIESEANKLGKKINQLSVEEMNIFWQQAKSN
ncbi:MAG: nucleoside triphosphate pyrophosphohydrolase [Flavobacteriaceae bacterium]|tara:strand:- start:1937 stop:2710 length:774 start_codon:yes stop_codon:yes gene_type:complete